MSRTIYPFWLGLNDYLALYFQVLNNSGELSQKPGNGYYESFICLNLYV